jgi:hypothetical protein
LSMKTYSKCKCDFDRPFEFVRVSHISIDIWEDGMTTPR